MSGWVDTFGKKMSTWVRSPSSEPSEFGIGDAPSPSDRLREEPAATSKKLYPNLKTIDTGGFASLSTSLPSSHPEQHGKASASGSKPRLREEEKGRANADKVEIDGDWFYAPSAPPFGQGRASSQKGGPSGHNAAEPPRGARKGEWDDQPSRAKFDLIGGHMSRQIPGGGRGEDRRHLPQSTDVVLREEHEKARAHYREELARREQEEMLTERQRQLMRRRPPPQEDEESENALDALLERVKVQWYPREVWAKMRFEDDYENLWGFNFDLVNRSAKLTLRKSRKAWWRASYSVQDMNLVVLTKKLPVPLLGAKMGRNIPSALQPHLQVGFGYDFSNHTKGFRWAITTPMQAGDGRRGNKEKWNVMNSPLDVSLNWSADVSLPELSGAMGTAEPRLSSDLGNYFFSVDKVSCTFTKRV